MQVFTAREILTFAGRNTTAKIENPANRQQIVKPSLRYEPYSSHQRKPSIKSVERDVEEGEIIEEEVKKTSTNTGLPAAKSQTYSSTLTSQVVPKGLASTAELSTTTPGRLLVIPELCPTFTKNGIKNTIEHTPVAVWWLTCLRDLRCDLQIYP